MRGSFTKGIIVGSIVGASVGMMLDNDMVMKRKRKMMKQGRRMMRASSEVIGNIVSLMM